MDASDGVDMCACGCKLQSVVCCALPCMYTFAVPWACPYVFDPCMCAAFVVVAHELSGVYATQWG